MDLLKLSEQNMADTHRFELLHPITDEETGVFIIVVSSENDKVKKFANSQFVKLQKEELQNARSRKQKVKTLDELEQERTESALCRIVGWENVEWKGKELPFTTENARMLLDECKWIAKQILEHSDDMGKFLKS